MAVFKRKPACPEYFMEGNFFKNPSPPPCAYQGAIKQKVSAHKPKETNCHAHPAPALAHSSFFPVFNINVTSQAVCAQHYLPPRDREELPDC